MLPFSREEIESYAKSNKLNWREDSSNITTKYLRNKLRHDVIPALKETNSQLLQNFNKTLSFLKDSNEIVEDRIAELQKKIVTIDGDLILFNIKKLQKLSNPKAYLYQFLKDFNFTEWDDVTNLLSAQSGKQVFSETHRLLKDRDVLILSEILLKDKVLIKISEKDNVIKTPMGKLIFEDVKRINTTIETIIYADKKKLQYPLILREWEEGDYFQPFGMKGKKKLSKFFKDEKLSLIEKEQTLLLCSGKDIVWIVGKRADDRFKVTEKTSQILKIQLL